MTKPSPTKKAAPRRRTTRKPKAPAAAPKVEMFDPAPPAGEPSAVAAAAEPAPEASQAERTPEAADGPPAEPAPQASFGEPEPVMLGAARGVLFRAPLGMVQALLSSEMADRVERLRSDRATLDLLDRMRATDGRCAPAIFTVADDAGEDPKLFDGAETIAAAINGSMPHIFMITVANRDAGAAQAYLAERGYRSTPQNPEDEDMLYRAMAHYSDV
jgi:hypothetical protein